MLSQNYSRFFICLITCFTLLGLSAQTTIDCQDFQSNTDGWNNDDGTRVSKNISGSSHSLRINNGDYAESDQYNFSAYDLVTLEFTFESENMETDSNDDDSYIVEFNDGSSWTEIKRVLHGYGFTNGVDQVVTLTVASSDYNFNGSNERFRIKNHTDATNDKLYIDDVCITGAVATQTALGCQNFQSNDNGWDNGSPKGEDYNKNISGSSRSYRMDSGEYAQSDNYNLSAYDIVTLQFTFESQNMETDLGDEDSYIVEFNDGSGWVILEQVFHGYGFTNGNDQDVSISILATDYNFNGSNERFRIKNHADSSNDKLYIDDVCVYGDVIDGSEIGIASNSQDIVDGDNTPTVSDNTDFGSVDFTSGIITKVFTITNSGSEVLTIGAITFSGAAQNDFSVSTAPNASVASGASTTFEVQFNPTAPGERSAAISIVTNDSDENPFNFSIKGEGVDPDVTEISCIDFESGANGWDNGDGSIANGSRINGINSFKLDQQDYAVSDAYNFSPYSVVTIDFVFESQNFETDSGDDDSYIVEFNDGTSGWVVLEQVYHGYGFTNGNHNSVSVSIAAADYDFEDGTNDVFRIKNHTDSTNDDLYIDDICIKGSVICYQTLICNSTTTWNGVTWSNGAPDETTEAIIDADYDTGDIVNFTCCKLSVTTGHTLTIHEGGKVDVQSDITNNGIIDIQDNGSLLQYYDYAVNTGDIKVTRKSNPMYKFDYTYWSSPVANYDMSSIAHSRAYHWNGESASWNQASGIMEAGKGYILRTDLQEKNVTSVTTAVFEGPMNNGRVYQPVSVDNDNEWILLGNPYPSAVDAFEFLSDTDNAAIIEGTAYFWTHNTRISNYDDDNGQFVENDYASWNLTGGVGTVAASGGTRPNGKIASGQGFFVQVSSAGQAKFSNCMRATDSSDNSRFFKPSQNQEETQEKTKIWLDVTNENGSYKQLLLGYLNGATNGIDRLYDGEILAGDNSVSLYSVVKDEEGLERKLIIQGRAAPFNEEEIIPIGFTLNEGSSSKNTISIDDVEGLFTSQSIYLLDKYTSVYHDLKESSYEFESESGEFNDRFELQFVKRTLSVGSDFDEVASATVNVAIDSEELVVASGIDITQVIVYDVLGSVAYSNASVDTDLIRISGLTKTNSLKVVAVTLSDGSTVRTKVIY